MRQFFFKIIYFSVFLIFSQNAFGEELCVFQIDSHHFKLRLIDTTGLTNIDRNDWANILYAKDPFLECLAKEEVVNQLVNNLRKSKLKEKSFDYRKYEKRISIFKEALVPILNDDLNEANNYLMPDFYTTDKRFLNSDKSLLVSGKTVGYLCTKPTIFANSNNNLHSKNDLKNSNFAMHYVYHQPTDKLIRLDGTNIFPIYSSQALSVRGLDGILPLIPGTGTLERRRQNYGSRASNFLTFPCDSNLTYSRSQFIDLRMVGFPYIFWENQYEIPYEVGGNLFGVVDSTFTYKKLYNFADTVPDELRKPF